MIGNVVLETIAEDLTLRGMARQVFSVENKMPAGITSNKFAAFTRVEPYRGVTGPTDSEFREGLAKVCELAISKLLVAEDKIWLEFMRQADPTYSRISAQAIKDFPAKSALVLGFKVWDDILADYECGEILEPVTKQETVTTGVLCRLDGKTVYTDAYRETEQRFLEIDDMIMVPPNTGVFVPGMCNFKDAGDRWEFSFEFEIGILNQAWEFWKIVN